MFFQFCTSVEQYSEFLKIASKIFFAITAHNAIVERIFSLIKAQWTDERNRFLAKSIRSIILIKFNFNDLNCFDFYEMIRENNAILMKVKSGEKYVYERRNKLLQIAG